MNNGGSEVMRYIGVEIVDLTTNRHFWFCKDLPGWPFPGGAIARLFYKSFAAQKRYPFQQYEIIPHIEKQPANPKEAGARSAEQRHDNTT